MNQTSLNELLRFVDRYYFKNGKAVRYYAPTPGARPRDVSKEPRDETGKWTAGGNKAGGEGGALEVPRKPSNPMVPEGATLPEEPDWPELPPPSKPQEALKGFAKAVRTAGSAWNKVSQFIQAKVHLAQPVAELATFAIHAGHIISGMPEFDTPGAPIHADELINVTHAAKELGHELHLPQATEAIVNLAGRAAKAAPKVAKATGKAIGEQAKTVTKKAAIPFLSQVTKSLMFSRDKYGMEINPHNKANLTPSLAVEIARRMKGARNPQWYASLLVAAMYQGWTWDRAMMIADRAYHEWEQRQREQFSLERAYYSRVGSEATKMIARNDQKLERYLWEENKHPRGQPKNAGQFGPGGGGGGAGGAAVAEPKPKMKPEAQTPPGSAPPSKSPALLPSTGAPTEGSTALQASPKIKSVEEQSEEVIQHLIANAYKWDGKHIAPRVEMPQIKAEDVSRFNDYMRKSGVNVSLTAVPVGELRATQKTIFAKKVAGMVSFVQRGSQFREQNPGAEYDIPTQTWTMPDGSNFQDPDNWKTGYQGVGGDIAGLNGAQGGEAPLASKDGFILDGHHRFAAQYVLDKDIPITVYQVDSNIQDLLDESTDWEDVSFANEEDKNPAETPGYDPGSPHWGGGSSHRELEPVYKHLGIGHEQALAMSGMGRNDTVEMYVGSDGRSLIYKGASQALASDGKPLYTVQRRVSKNAAGEMTMRMEGIEVHPSERHTKSKPGKGLGVQQMLRAVMTAAENGISHVVAHPTGSSNKSEHTAYSMLAEMGYDADIPKDLKDKLPPRLKGAKSLMDLTKKWHGRTWWRQNGRGIPMSFNPDPRGPAMQRFRIYSRRMRALRKVGEKYHRENSDVQRFRKSKARVS